MIEVLGVSKRYGGVEALQNVTLTVPGGSVVGLLGQNGAGKTTLEKILAGLLPAEGRFSAFGKPLTLKEIHNKNESAAYRRRVGAVFQQIEFRVVCASVFDEIMFGPLKNGLEREEAKARTEQVLDFCNIRRLVHRLPQNISGGEKKMVAIAAMLAENPEVMIFDEPTNDLDLENQKWLVTALNQLGDAGKTVITATHVLETARELADRVWIIGDNHRLIADGGVELLSDSCILDEAGIQR